ncbi:hypothetical protein LEP1GSC171_3718 [Leptospira santarosai str. HAI1380]|uniref:Uncharacterized protein n=3 Tax=Leptospira santarosai TaxID=28183 RepID=M6UNP7_9LEPT|nr:hypothetical protein LEP1GSC179_3061 [Leptospira santarosai str. MOR084]EKR90150.1 hypothetical protein LEP1GSC163_3118 [Leptospira santarosai str. CBC379]EMJ49488.1 hypothetical protein LEP1GSC169_3815 [Leptospira santarosai str. HAI1349]EMM75537.1 hypothetical protein LEP1GSC040_3448 [Leptospira santarosai str. 2000030832]EMN21959.1 hypothetical protein LEP1GSC063_3562 [Leptospira santarosai serovar Arenal str. MAVJ 401]EMO22654.1 hypothetical protein LEP1GSC168_1870 [Leptospira santarosa
MDRFRKNHSRLGINNLVYSSLPANYFCSPMFNLRKLIGFDPFDFFTGHSSKNESQKSNYKITLKLHSLNKILKKKISKSDDPLESLEFDSENGVLILTGHFSIQGLFWSRFLKTDSVDYNVSLAPVRVVQNQVRLQIHSFRLFSHSSRKLDPIRIFSKIFQFHRRFILETIVEEIPEILRLTGIRNVITVNMDYFLSEIPDLAGNITIQKVIPEKGNVFLFVRSGTILKPLLDFFGPEYIRIEPISENHDTLLLLWRD